MKTSLSTDNYRIICLVFSGIILVIFGYSFVFGSGTEYPLPSGSDLLNRDQTISKGLSRSFSAIVRFQFDEARAYNPYGIKVFFFFFIQLFMRTIVIILSAFVHGKQRNVLIISDIILSLILFLVCFRPFIQALANMCMNGTLFFFSYR